MAQRKTTGRSKAPSAPIALAPVVLIKGSEGLLGDRAMDRLRTLAYEADPQTERTDVSAASYQAGQLDMLTSPSLFGEARLIIIPDLETMSDALLNDLLTYVSQPVDDVWLLLRHNGGTRGKKLLDAITKAGFPVITADPLKNDKDKLDLVFSDVKAARRQIDPEAAQALVDALGSDVRSLAAAVSQLLADVEGRIGVEEVRRYHAGRVEASGFEVADAAIAGDSARALMLLRHAFATGTDPVPLVAALAMKLRGMAKVSVAGSAGPSKLGMAPWQIERARRELRGWSDGALAGAIRAVATADEEVKGLSRSPEHAVEKAVLTICRLRGASQSFR
ncbi:DNA polymerase III subunit delta [Schaalia canis]|uniref:DNA-directed DNA polymerase n=1 Tax=Schaalia canis TaxID=100469 RepID=A0A3P1SBC8_9ACTO|nr:DNA polymerase III subunit delta [Schaalia canis]RRC94563.1 DNA polymerase III subunit delta [Schaalia canis]